VLEKNSTHGGATCLSVETCEAISVFIYFSETPPSPPPPWSLLLGAKLKTAFPFEN